MDESNKKAHHTDMYNSSELILRRGQSCRLTLEFNNPLRDWQSIVFIACTGPQNSAHANTKVEFPLSSSWSSGMWSAVLESSPGNSLRIIMSSPANAAIGRYDLSVQISVMDQTVTYSLGKFILLFNPWCVDDDVYMANEDERQEYVLNDHGVIFMGNEKHVTGMGWNYGQFENNILNICLDILDRSLNCQKDPALDCSQRHSPIYVGRIISAMINSNDDYGVLEGKWEKEFSDGVDPNSWNGSVEILWQWKNGEYKPVKYGQCWVFAAVMCTVLRSLGIPTRVITNFNSAHNTDGNMIIDMYYDTDGKFLELSDDSIWNFHVWNESWFLRRDLGLYYSGWQVLDSTPQEESQGVYRCGPTSVIAVKEGDIHLGYDAPFVFAEVNADRETWIVQKDGTREKAHNDTKYVGQSISTKAVGSDARVDVTNNYKYPEGSPQERQAFDKATKNMPNYVPPSENVSPAPNNMMNRNRNDSPMRSSTPTPNTDLDRRPSSPAPSSGRAVQPPSESENQPAYPSPSSVTERGRAASPARFPGRPSATQPSESDFRPASPLPSSPATERGRTASPARFPGRSSAAQPSESEFRPASPLPSGSATERGRASSPARLPGRASTPQPSESEFRPASPLPSSVDSERGRTSSPARYRSRTSTPQPSESEFHPASPLPSSVDSERGRASSPARFPGRTLTPQPSESDFQPASPLPRSADRERGRSSSPARFPGRTSAPQPSENEFRSASSLPNLAATERGRASSPARFPGRTSTTTYPSESEFRPASPLPSSVDSERGRSSSPARYIGRTSTPQPPEREFRPASPAPVDRPSSPAMFSSRPAQPRSGSEYRPASPSPNIPAAERGRSSSPVPFSGRPSPAQPSRNEYRPGSPSPATPTGRPSSPAMYSGRPGYRSASPLPSSPVSGSGRSSSPVPFSGRPSPAQPSGYRYRSTSPAPNGRPSSPASFSGGSSHIPYSGVGYRNASPSPAAPSGRPLPPALFSGYPSRPLNSSNAYWPASHSPPPPRPSSSASERSDIAGKFKLLSPLVVGDDINLLLILKNLTPYHRPVKVILSAFAILYTGRRVNDLFSDQKSLIISPNQDAHISLQIPYSHYSRGLNEGNMIQAVALCELPFGSKVVITKDLVLESPPITIKPLSNPMLHKTMSLEIRFTNPLQMAITDCLLVVEGSGLVDRQLSAVVPYLKPNEKIKFKVELTPYRSGIRQLIANFKCKYFSIKGYQLLNVESW